MEIVKSQNYIKIIIERMRELCYHFYGVSARYGWETVRLEEGMPGGSENVREIRTD